MKILNQNIVYASLLTLLILPTSVQATDIFMSTYYPSLSGSYNQLHLVPRTTNLTGACTVGTLYVNASSSLQYCRSNAGTGTWGDITDNWTENSDNIYPTDNDSQPNLHIGIGTKTPEFKLSINNDAGIIAKGNFGSGYSIGNVSVKGTGKFSNSSKMMWYPIKAAFRAGYFNGSQWSDNKIGDYSAALGAFPTASGSYSVVGGGDTNTASGQYSTVIGGQSNTAIGDYSTIIGGKSNTTNNQYATITGGLSNSATANFTTIVGGQSNQATAIYATVGGGSTNIVSTPYSNINGGQNNTIDQLNGPATGYSVIGGGANNQARNDYTVISGGSSNSAIAPYASVGGGDTNIAGYFSPAGSQACPSCPIQAEDMLTGLYSRVSGGASNNCYGDASIISGGRNNFINGAYSAVGGGIQNSALGNYSTVGGGERNNVAGNYSTIMGGTDNLVSGVYSWAGGKNMQLAMAAARTFAWGYSDTAVAIDTPDSFIIAPGTLSGNPWQPKVGIRDLSPVGVLEINANSATDDYIDIKKTVAGDTFIIKNNGYIGVGKATPFPADAAMQFGNANNAYLSAGGVWTNGSSRTRKENIEPLSSAIAQTTLDQLNPVTFNYKVSEQTNAGFIAEDVPDIVAMKGRRSLSSMDIIAVLTKVSKDQEQQINEQKQKIKKIRNEINTLKKELGE